MDSSSPTNEVDTTKANSITEGAAQDEPIYITQCKACGGDISRAALTCPRCGHPGPELVRNQFWQKVQSVLEDAVDAHVDADIDPWTLEPVIEPIVNRLKSIEEKIDRLSIPTPTQPENNAEPNSLEATDAYVGRTVALGSYPVLRNGSELPIAWTMISVAGKYALLISQYVLDCKPWLVEAPNGKSDKSAYDYENSDLKAWLEGEFFDSAFSEDEKARIVAPPAPISHDQYEASILRGERTALTEYAELKYIKASKDEAGYPKGWWLSNVQNAKFPRIIKDDGSDATAGCTRIVGVRPAIWVTLDTEPGAREAE